MRCYQQRAEFRGICSTECPGSLAKLYTMMIGQDFLDIPYHICTGKNMCGSGSNQSLEFGA